MKGCNQVAHANLPHPVRLTCQNASLMTESLDCLRKTMGGRTVHVMHKSDVFYNQSVPHLVYNISILRAVNKLSQM